MRRTPETDGRPAEIAPGAVRWARASARYEATVGFYRDLVRLPVIGEFRSSFGEDGTIFGLPDTRVQMEIVRARPGEAASGSFDQLVMYLQDDEAVELATAALRAADHAPDPEPHPYWAANGAVTYTDPDGRGVVYAPWVYGQVPDPVDRPGVAQPTAQPTDRPTAQPTAQPTGLLRIDWFDGERTDLRGLFEEAEDSPVRLDGYINEGRVLVARLDDEVVGHLQLVETDRVGEVELKNMAVVSRVRGTGIGRQLVERAIAASEASYWQMVVATAAADVDNLRFYQRRGFRFSGVERDAFDAEAGYTEGSNVDGIPLRDRVWFTRPL